MSPPQPGPASDPYTVLGLASDASLAEIIAAYRAAVRACHPDTHHLLREPEHRATHNRPQHADFDSDSNTPLSVHIHHRPHPPQPDLRAGPVRHHR
jgi:hypothetical protein